MVYINIVYIFPPRRDPLREIIAAPIQTITNTISNNKVLSVAFVLELKALKYIKIINKI